MIFAQPAGGINGPCGWVCIGVVLLMVGYRVGVYTVASIQNLRARNPRSRESREPVNEETHDSRE